jgi:hypothetical protein
MNSSVNDVVEVLSRLVFLSKHLTSGLRDSDTIVKSLQTAEFLLAVNQLASLAPALNNVEKMPDNEGQFKDPMAKISSYLFENLSKLTYFGGEDDPNWELLGKITNGVQMAENFVKNYGFELIETKTVFFGIKRQGFRVNGKDFFEGDLV